VDKITDFDNLFRTYYVQLYFYAFHIINDIEASKDIASDSFEYLWKNQSEISLDTVKSFLYTFVRNKCIDYLRHENIHEQYTKYIELTKEDVDTSYDEFDERISLVRMAMNKLTPHTRHILEECYIQHKQYKEVALELDISVNAVKKHIIKALHILREEFDKKQ
jgi:RNA polymerase sigma-70 factor (family 1)